MKDVKMVGEDYLDDELRKRETVMPMIQNGDEYWEYRHGRGSVFKPRQFLVGKGGGAISVSTVRVGKHACIDHQNVSSLMEGNLLTVRVFPGTVPVGKRLYVLGYEVNYRRTEVVDDSPMPTKYISGVKYEEVDHVSKLPPILWQGERVLEPEESKVFTPEGDLRKQLEERADMLVEHLQKLGWHDRGSNIYASVYYFARQNFEPSFHVFVATWLTILVTQKAERQGVRI